MREAYLENSCCIYARKRGCFPIKLSNGITGVPDRLFLLPHRKAWLVEFKVPDADLSPRQRIVHEQLRLLMHPVDVIRTTGEFRLRLDKMLEGGVDSGL